MPVISLHDVSLSFGGAPLLDKVNLIIEHGDRACLVGRNGTGKSSLLKLLSGEHRPDEGEIRCPKNTRVSYMPQAVPMDMEGLIGDIIAEELADPSARHDWQSSQVVGRILSHLGLDGWDDFSTLSGGQKRRVLLGRAVAAEPDLLLLDEPTNHLDIETICWMEKFLQQNCPTLLFVTHDRSFLRNLANRIIDLDRGKLADWSCDYDTFLQRKADLLHDEAVRNANFDKKLAKEEAWIRQGIKARRTRNEGRVKALKAMRDERRARRDVEGTARLQLQQSERSGRKVIETKQLSFAYDDGTSIVKNLDTLILRGDKIGIVGPNGSGKTTLIKLFTGQLKPSSGSVDIGTKLNIAYFDQHRDALNNSTIVADSVDNGNEFVEINGNRRHVISYLQDFLFPPDRAKSPISVLSGGERNRLLLARLFAKPSNMLIMDEPTNDLDVETLDLLEEQLMNYQGTVLIVSHDRAFLNNVVTSLYLMGDGTVTEHIGNYAEWEERNPVISAASAKKARKAEALAASKQDAAQSKEHKKQLQKVEKAIEQKEAELKSLHAAMAEDGYYQQEASQVAKDAKREEVIRAELEALFSQWESLT